MFFLKSNKPSFISDKELMLRYRNSGEAHYVGKLFERYTHLLFGVCMKYLKNEEDSKDAVMEVFEKLLTELMRHEVENFQAWLFFVAKNHCLMKLRKEKAQLNQKDGYENFVKDVMEIQDNTHLTEGALVIQMEEKLRNGLTCLKEEQKICIELYYFENKSYQEIAEQSGYSMMQVKSFLQNGKRNLKLYLINSR